MFEVFLRVFYFNFKQSAILAEGLSTPIEEPKKVIRCHFLGVTQVPKATGIEILNEAVDRLVSQVRYSKLFRIENGED